MDADNRVVLNCGGIRHEVYKVKQSIGKEKHFRKWLDVGCRQLFNYINLLADISHYPINHVIFRYIYEYREMLLGNFKEDSSHSTVKTYGGLGKLRSSPQ